MGEGQLNYMSDAETVTFIIYRPTLDRQDYLATLKNYKEGDPVGIGADENEAIRDVVRQLGKKEVQ